MRDLRTRIFGRAPVTPLAGAMPSNARARMRAGRGAEHGALTRAGGRRLLAFARRHLFKTTYGHRGRRPPLGRRPLCSALHGPPAVQRSDRASAFGRKLACTWALVDSVVAHWARGTAAPPDCRRMGMYTDTSESCFPQSCDKECMVVEGSQPVCSAEDMQGLSDIAQGELHDYLLSPLASITLLAAVA